jgi:hypothetical protein
LLERLANGFDYDSADDLFKPGDPGRPIVDLVDGL